MTDDTDFIDIPKMFKDEPSRSANEIEIRNAVDVLWLVRGNADEVDECEWKEGRYLSFTGKISGGLHPAVGIPAPKGTITYEELNRKLKTIK